MLILENRKIAQNKKGKSSILYHYKRNNFDEPGNKTIILTIAVFKGFTI